MLINNSNQTMKQNLQQGYSTYANTDMQEPGNNGLTGFKTWECYMLVKFGKSGSFGIGGSSEYLLELPIYPDNVTESISSNWETQNVLGRSAALSAYANTSLKSVNFSLDLHRDLMTGSFSHNTNTLLGVSASGLRNQAAGLQKQTSRGPFATRTWYTNANKMLQICCYPQYTSSGLIPPTTYFVFGQMILKGYVTSYSTTWKKPILNTFYGWNSVNISMECYPDTIVSAKNIISGVGAASTQNTYNTVFPNNVGSSNVMQRSDTTNRSNARTRSAIGGSVADT